MLRPANLTLAIENAEKALADHGESLDLIKIDPLDLLVLVAAARNLNRGADLLPATKGLLESLRYVRWSSPSYKPDDAIKTAAEAVAKAEGR